MEQLCHSIVQRNRRIDRKLGVFLHPPRLDPAEAFGYAQVMAAQKPINMTRLSTLVAVAILVGTELVGASWAAGWALGGLFQLDPMVSRGFEIVFGLIGFVGLYFFMRTAVRHEPLRG